LEIPVSLFRRAGAQALILTIFNKISLISGLLGNGDAFKKVKISLDMLMVIITQSLFMSTELLKGVPLSGYLPYGILCTSQIKVLKK